MLGVRHGCLFCSRTPCARNRPTTSGVRIFRQVKVSTYVARRVGGCGPFLRVASSLDFFRLRYEDGGLRPTPSRGAYTACAAIEGRAYAFPDIGGMAAALHLRVCTSACLPPHMIWASSHPTATRLWEMRPRKNRPTNVQISKTVPKYAQRRRGSS